jgi:hypothetical protein
MYIGNNYIDNNYTPGVINAPQILDFTYDGGTIIHTNGGIQTDYLTIMQVGTIRSGTVLPQPTTAGVYMDLVQGVFPSANDYSNIYPFQLRLTGCSIANSAVKNSYIGLWSEGRLIIGINDYGFQFKGDSFRHAVKASIDGALYVNKNIYCSFGDNANVYKLTKETLQLRVVKNGEIVTEPYDVIIAGEAGTYQSDEGPDPMTPSGDGGGTALTSTSDIIVIDSAILDNAGGA